MLWSGLEKVYMRVYVYLYAIVFMYI